MHWGTSFTYTLANLTPGGTYTVRLHFAELYQNGAGLRTFNVAINGSMVLSNFDVFQVAGGLKKALVESFTARANSQGKLTITFTAIKGNAMVSGLEVLAAG
jgi:hypothetical protein